MGRCITPTGNEDAKECYMRIDMALRHNGLNV